MPLQKRKLSQSQTVLKPTSQLEYKNWTYHPPKLLCRTLIQIPNPLVQPAGPLQPASPILSVARSPVSPFFRSHLPSFPRNPIFTDCKAHGNPFHKHGYPCGKRKPRRKSATKNKFFRHDLNIQRSGNRTNERTGGLKNF